MDANTHAHIKQVAAATVQAHLVALQTGANPASWVQDVVRAGLVLTAISGGANRTLWGLLLPLIALAAYEQAARYMAKLAAGAVTSAAPVAPSQGPVQSAPPPPPEANATITCSKTFEGTKPADRVDAVISHIAHLAETKALHYNGLDYMPDVKEEVALEQDVYFQVTRRDDDGKGGIQFLQFQLITYTKDVHHLQRFIEQCQDRHVRRQRNKLGSGLYYFDQVVNKQAGMNGPSLSSSRNSGDAANTEYLVFRRNGFHTTRNFGNVFFEQRETLQKRVKFFKSRRDWYEAKGIPYTLGFMFSGEPGCGKTSSVKTIANETRRHVIEVKLSEIKTNTQLKHLFYNEELMVWDAVKGSVETLYIPIADRLYVIEDIDAMKSVVLNRKGKDAHGTLELEAPPVPSSYSEFMAAGAAGVKEGGPLAADAQLALMPPRRGPTVPDPLDLATVLNILDGTLEVPGRILCITTNFPDRLDDALIRPGRIDMLIEFKRCNRDVLTQMMNSFYSEQLAAPASGRVCFMVDDFPPALDYVWTPAEVNQVLFQHFEDPEEALAALVRGRAPERPVRDGPNPH